MSIAARLQDALNSFKSTSIEIDLVALGKEIHRLIKDVGQLHVVTAGDLHVYSVDGVTPPADVREAMRWGTKFFDAVYYFALEAAARPKPAPGQDGMADLQAHLVAVKKRLLWTAIFLMLRGSYPTSTTGVVGADVPAFLVKICAMTETPAEVAAGLASFNLEGIDPRWIRQIEWQALAQPIRQRMALGLAGYRALGPFRLYDLKPGVTAEVSEAYHWVKKVTTAAPDYAILSCTRDAVLVSRLGSWNKALGNLMLECFTDAQLAEMGANKIIFSKPVRDPRADSWKTWSKWTDFALTDPIGL